MIKEKQLKKKLIIESGMMASFLVFLSVVAFIGSSIATSMEDEKNKLQSGNAALMSENTSIQNHIKKASTSIGLYQILVKNNRDRDFGIDREAGKTVFLKLKDKYHLILTGNNAFNQIVELTDEQYKRKTVQVVASDADMSFQSTTDELAFQFIRDLYKKLTGFTLITSLQMSKQSDITSQALVELGAGRFPALVNTSIKFKWIGLKPIPQNPDPNQPPKTETGATP